MANQEQLQPTSVLTLAEWAKRLDPDGKIATIVELLNKTNLILDDAVWVQGNLPTGHLTTVRADIPRATWRKLNYGVVPKFSKTAQVTDTHGMLEQYSEVDKKLADLNGNTAAFRLSEDLPILEGMNQDMAETLFYGSTVSDPEQFLGLAPRYGSIGTPSGKPTANNYMAQVINSGGSTADSMTSIWLIVWGENTVHMFFPKGSKAGLEQQDLGEVTLIDPAGGRYQGYRTHYKWEAGLSVRDWRYIVRIANVDPADPQAALDHKDMIQAVNTIPNLGMGTPVFYCNRVVKTRLDIAAADKSNAFLQIKDVFGQPQTAFWGIPIKQCDSLVNTEAVLT